ncbi:N-alpha-acetyltransferase 40 isoform X4 [Cuculus canorus]|uniref:N-alpha-acetyltransferase 40 isoform X4 n=1 Tax=Cuculus canorus TaxID=55661 RepID=UPI0023AA74DD|nr:N-alpha-acetyltransferase 40 isoform X4 [Cuculus canorus]
MRSGPARAPCFPHPPACRSRHGEEIKQSQGEEAEAFGRASGHGRRLCQGGSCQQRYSLVFFQLEDPLEAFPVFKRYERNGLNVAIECKRGSGLEPATLEWAFELTKANMQSLYEQSEWGWKEREKREELRDERAWYLIARDSATGPVAFSHFRFDVECGDEVLYCYEVQLESRVRRRGLGKFLLQILQLVANSTQMKKVMLTVFKHNHGAYQFFREALQFEVDATSPGLAGCCGDPPSYEILSRRTRFGESLHAGGGHCGGCCR